MPRLPFARSIVCLVVLAGAPAAIAAASATAAPSGQMTIDARSTTFDGHAHTYQVRGDVRIGLPKLEVRCEEATVYADPTDAKVLRIVFNGHVEARKGTDTFHADRITYYVAERRLVAEGTTHTRLKLPDSAGSSPAGP